MAAGLLHLQEVRGARHPQRQQTLDVIQQPAETLPKELDGRVATHRQARSAQTLGFRDAELPPSGRNELDGERDVDVGHHLIEPLSPTVSSISSRRRGRRRELRSSRSGRLGSAACPLTLSGLGR